MCEIVSRCDPIPGARGAWQAPSEGYRFAAAGPNNVRCKCEKRAEANIVKPVRRACARGSKFGQDASPYVASRRARAVRAKCSLAGLTKANSLNKTLPKFAWRCGPFNDH